MSAWELVWNWDTKDQWRPNWLAISAVVGLLAFWSGVAGWLA